MKKVRFKGDSKIEFVQTQKPTTNHDDDEEDLIVPERIYANSEDLVSILETKTKHEKRTLPFKTKKKCILPQANGSAKSIVQWGIKAGLDKH